MPADVNLPPGVSLTARIKVMPDTGILRALCPVLIRPPGHWCPGWLGDIHPRFVIGENDERRFYGPDDLPERARPMVTPMHKRDELIGPWCILHRDQYRRERHGTTRWYYTVQQREGRRPLYAGVYQSDGTWVRVHPPLYRVWGPVPFPPCVIVCPKCGRPIFVPRPASVSLVDDSLDS
jgi:hypothetical protein